MAADKDLNLTTKKDSSGNKKKSKNKLIIILLVITLLVSGLAAGYFLFLKDQPASFENSELPNEIVAFAYARLPDLYSEIAAIDDEISYTKREINRIETVGKTYPDQVKIADTELKTWNANLASLDKCRIEFEKQLKMLYVSYQVNPETGQALMDEKTEPLKSLVDPVVTASKVLTDKLRVIDAAKGFIEKITDKFLKK